MLYVSQSTVREGKIPELRAWNTVSGGKSPITRKFHSRKCRRLSARDIATVHKSPGDVTAVALVIITQTRMDPTVMQLCWEGREGVVHWPRSAH